MRRPICLTALLVLSLGFTGCSFDNTPKRLNAYLPSATKSPETKQPIPDHPVTAALVVLNDTGFEKSAPQLRKGTLETLGERLKSELEKHQDVSQ